MDWDKGVASLGRDRQASWQGGTEGNQAEIRNGLE